MALITIAGFPCSGKSRRANQLKEYFEKRLGEPSHSGPKPTVVIVDDETNHVPRTVYDDSISEKSGRANLYAAVTRSLGPETITICDSLNYIKGFRYQMYCAAREARIRVCTVHIVAPPEKCREWHEQRGESSYKPATFDNLLMRFEEPSSMVRWDSPLFTISWDEEPPYKDIWETITKGQKKPPTGSVAVSPKPPPNTLQTLSKTTTSITTSLLSFLQDSPHSSTFPIPSPPAAAPNSLILHLPTRRITLSEMQRLKRQYESVQTTAQRSHGLAAGAFAEAEVASGFTRFLEATWETTP